MEADAPSKAAEAPPSSQPRVPDSRLPGVDALEDAPGDLQKQAGLDPFLVDEDEQGSKGYELSALALWPVSILIAIGVLVTTATLWYGPKMVLQELLRYLVPESPNAWHALTIWGAIVLCITLAIPVLLLLLPVPTLMFGFWKGFLITFMALMFAAFLSFVIGRYIAFRPVRHFLEGRGCRRALRMLHVLEEEHESMQLLVLYRFLCIPMAARNYGPSVLNVPLPKLVLSALPHSLWSAAVFASAGSALQGPAQLLRDGHKVAWQTPQWQQLLGLAVALFSLTLFSWVAYRAYARLEAEEKGPAAPTGQSTLFAKDSEEGGNAVNYGSAANYGTNLRSTGHMSGS